MTVKAGDPSTSFRLFNRDAPFLTCVSTSPRLPLPGSEATPQIPSPPNIAIRDDHTPARHSLYNSQRQPFWPPFPVLPADHSTHETIHPLQPSTQTTHLAYLYNLYATDTPVNPVDTVNRHPLRNSLIAIYEPVVHGWGLRAFTTRPPLAPSSSRSHHTCKPGWSPHNVRLGGCCSDVRLVEFSVLAHVARPVLPSLGTPAC